MVRTVAPRGALQAVCDAAGMSKRSVSLAMGRHETFVTTITNKSKGGRVSTLAAVADVCGYDLVLRNDELGDEIRIVPPKRGDAE